MAAAQETEIRALRSRLQVAESERLPLGVAGGFLALLVASLGGMAYLWRDRRRVQPKTAFAHSENAGHADGFRAPIARQALAGAPESAADPSALAAPDDDSLLEMSELEFDKLMASGRAYSAFRKGSLPPVSSVRKPLKPNASTARLIHSETLVELRQQAGFLASLGQTEQALRVLEHHILENGESSPVVYLDLLDILHAKGLKTQFRKFRDEFNLLFNGKVPEFADFREPGKDLEDYTHVLAHITALWPSAKVLMVIEAAIFRDPWEETRAQLGLTAFRDLILLHAIAQANAMPAQPLARAPAILDLDLTEAVPRSEHAAAVPSWRGDFQNTAPGGLTPSAGATLATKPHEDRLQPLAPGNMIDFELPLDESPPANGKPAA